MFLGVGGRREEDPGVAHGAVVEAQEEPSLKDLVERSAANSLSPAHHEARFFPGVAAFVVPVDEFFDVVFGGKQRGGDHAFVGNLSHDGGEDFDEEGVFGDGGARAPFGDFGVGEGEHTLDDGEDLFDPAHAAEVNDPAALFEVLARSWEGFGEVYELLVTEDALSGFVRACGAVLSPLVKLAQGRQFSALDAARPRCSSPGFGVVGLVEDLFLPDLDFFGVPVPAAQFFASFDQKIPGFEEMAHVFKGVVDLGVVEGAFSPVGAGLGGFYPDVEGLAQEFAVGDRVAGALESGQHLDIDDAAGESACVLKAEVEFCASGVHDDFATLAAEGVPEGGEVLDGDGVYDGLDFVRGDLDQAKLWVVGVFGDELGVEGNARGLAQVRAEAFELVRLGDELGERVGLCAWLSLFLLFASGICHVAWFTPGRSALRPARCCRRCCGSAQPRWWLRG